MRDQLKWYDDKAENRRGSTRLLSCVSAEREGYCYQHVQAITVAIDQYAEHRDYFSTSPRASG
jgi:hypothetical protein